MSDAQSKRPRSWRGKNGSVQSAHDSDRQESAEDQSSGSRDKRGGVDRTVCQRRRDRIGGIIAAQKARIDELIKIQENSLELLKSYRLEMELLGEAVDDEPKEDSDIDSGESD